MIVKNIFENAVEENLEYLVKEGLLEGCTCEQCLSDIKAIALNSLTPKYVVLDGELPDIKNALTPTNKTADITSKILLASKHVNRNPRHKGKKK